MKATLLSLAALVATVLAPATPAEAGGSSASCHGSWPISMAPGISTTARQSTFTSHGETGTITCTGTVNGHGVSGPGTLGVEGALDGTCLTGNGSLTITMTIPTSGGPATFSLPATMTYYGGVGMKFSDAFVGPLTFAVVPTAGNCITEPLTEILQVGEFVLQS
jgi:hypothetical protein